MLTAGCTELIVHVYCSLWSAQGIALSVLHDLLIGVHYPLTICNPQAPVDPDSGLIWGLCRMILELYSDVMWLWLRSILRDARVDMSRYEIEAGLPS